MGFTRLQLGRRNIEGNRAGAQAEWIQPGVGTINHGLQRTGCGDQLAEFWYGAAIDHLYANALYTPRDLTVIRTALESIGPVENVNELVELAAVAADAIEAGGYVDLARFVARLHRSSAIERLEVLDG